MALLAEGQGEVVARVSVFRVPAEGFPELADRLVGLALPGQGDAEVAVGVGVIRLHFDGLPVLADRVVSLAFLDERVAEIVIGVGVIRFEAEGFLILANRLVGLAFLVEGVAQVVIREAVVPGDFDCMPEQGLAVLPISELLPGEHDATGDCQAPRHPQEDLRLAIGDWRLDPGA